MSSETCSPIHLFQFDEAYNNLQNISRRHIHVHEPLIYDAVWVAAKTMDYSKVILRYFNQTFSTTTSGIVKAAMQNVLKRYSYSGSLTVSCTL